MANLPVDTSPQQLTLSCCVKYGRTLLTGDAFKLYNKNPGKWEKEHKMQTPKKSGMDAKKKAAKNKTQKEGELADAASGL